MKRAGKCSFEQMVFYTMAVVGGCLASYTVLRTGVLGTAQTSNLISLAIMITGGSLRELAMRTGALALYVISIALTRVIKSFGKVDVRFICLLVDAAAVVILVLMPEKTDALLALYPVFFAMPFQWNSFTGAHGYSSSSIFSTNNLRQMVDGAAECICTGNKEAGRKSLFFAGTLLFFHTGVVVTAVAWRFVANLSVLICLPLLAAAAVEMLFDTHFKLESK